MSHKSRKDRPMNAYVANIIQQGTPFTIGKVLYFELQKPRSMFIDGKLTPIGVSTQRVKAREISS